MRGRPEGVAEHGAVEHGASFETFFDAERARLFGTLCLVTGDRGEAEELMQEAFVRVWERWDKVRAHPDPSGICIEQRSTSFETEAAARSAPSVV